MSFNLKKTINNRAKKYILFENRMTVNILIVNYLRPERVYRVTRKSICFVDNLAVWKYIEWMQTTGFC